MPPLKKILIPGCLTFVFFTLVISHSFGQEGILKGFVKDNETPLSAATVSVANNNTVTNSKGEFFILLNPGTYIVVITHVGYKKFEQQIIITANESQILETKMIRSELLDGVVVLGSRSIIQRSNLTTTVPVDGFSSIQLLRTRQPSLIQMLNFAVPYVNVSRQHLAEPITLRGLSPDHMLILLNGIRYHGAADINAGGIRGTLGRGSVGNDLNSIPFSAIDKIEILRDGASAQYGSDAIAGVMNIELKKATGKTSINLHLGQYYKGDGESITFGINHGIKLFQEKGFLNFSGDFRYRKPTYRGGEYLGTVYKTPPSRTTTADSLRVIAQDDSIISARNFNRKTPVSNDGSIELSNGGLLINGGYPLGNKIELFWMGTVSYNHPVVQGQYRFPKNSDQVNTNIYPDGFKPQIVFNSLNVSGSAGAKGTTAKGWVWEWHSIFGQYSTGYYYSNTNNASQALLPNPQTSFFNGAAAFSQQTNTVSMVRDLAKNIGRVKTFTIGLGAEYRFENYRTKAGEEASWENYDPTLRKQGGTQPMPGIRRTDIVNESRSIGGLYVDLETDLNDHFLINMSGRYEYYNDFGNNLAGKLAMRYKFSSKISLRGSVSNGYHAPSLQQIYYTSIIAGTDKASGVSVPVRIGIFSNNSAVAVAFGVNPLQPEKAINLSSGFTSTISPNINLTIDGYWIQIKNRIILSGTFKKTNPDVKKILQDMPDIDQVQFISNAISTRTRGLDIVMNGNWKIHKANFGCMLAANFSRTNIFGPIQIANKLPVDSLNKNTLFNREEKAKLENGQPGSKIILSADYKRGKFGMLVRNTRFGKTSAVFNSADHSQDEFFSAKILTDVSMSYSPITSVTITTGANNVFNIYPDPLKNKINSNQGILIYSNEAMPFGYNGGYYFLTLNFDF